MNTIKYKKLNLESNQLLLDMGCGEGRHSIGALLETPANVIGMDLSVHDLKIAKHRLNDFDLSDIKSLNYKKMYIITSLILGSILGSILILIYSNFRK